MPTARRVPSPSPTRVGPEAESPYVSVRELHDMERRLNESREKSMEAMEGRLTKAIEASNTSHERTHEDMRLRAEERHKPINEFLREAALDEEDELLEKAKAAGVRRIFTGTWTLIKVLDQHWRVFALLIAAILAFAGNIHISFTGS